MNHEQIMFKNICLITFCMIIAHTPLLASFSFWTQKTFLKTHIMRQKGFRHYEGSSGILRTLQNPLFDCKAGFIINYEINTHQNMLQVALSTRRECISAGKADDQTHDIAPINTNTHDLISANNPWKTILTYNGPIDSLSGHLWCLLVKDLRRLTH